MFTFEYTSGSSDGAEVAVTNDLRSGKKEENISTAAAVTHVTKNNQENRHSVIVRHRDTVSAWSHPKQIIVNKKESFKPAGVVQHHRLRAQATFYRLVCTVTHTKWLF